MSGRYIKVPSAVAACSDLRIRVDEFRRPQCLEQMNEAPLGSLMKDWERYTYPLVLVTVDNHRYVVAGTMDEVVRLFGLEDEQA